MAEELEAVCRVLVHKRKRRNKASCALQLQYEHWSRVHSQ